MMCSLLDGYGATSARRADSSSGISSSGSKAGLSSIECTKKSWLTRGRLDEARSAVKAGLALNPAFTVSRADAAWTAMSDDPTYVAQLEPIFDGMRKAGVPEE
jgi:hypothetical protein